MTIHPINIYVVNDYRLRNEYDPVLVGDVIGDRVVVSKRRIEGRYYLLTAPVEMIDRSVYLENSTGEYSSELPPGVPTSIAE